MYIHGFYGNDQSFQSFPAHVHNCLSSLLSDSHVIHSKVYPRYKTYKAIEVARDNFSAWLEPHESPTTDVILVGHSMGGLLAAEVVLMPNQSPYRQQPFKHRILGSLSLDSPFLGLHPGIVVSGIASLFQPAPKSPEPSTTPQPSGAASPSSTMTGLEQLPSLHSQTSLSSMASSPYTTQTMDSNFDPPYPNDAPFREQPFTKRLMHFAAKHKREGIIKSMRNHVMSHLEFGGCLADYPAMKARYSKLRALEDVDEIKALEEGHPAGAYGRVRFANYYTLSPGRPKVAKEARGLEDEGLQPLSPEADSETTSTARIELLNLSDTGENETAPMEVSEALPPQEITPRNSTTDELSIQDAPEDVVDENRMSLLNMEPIPMEDEEEPPAKETVDELDLPPVPDPPAKPQLPDLEQFTDKDAKKQAEKESKRLQKTYEQAVKDRAKAIRERDKLVEKRRKTAQREAEKLNEKQAKEQKQREKEEKKQATRQPAAAASESAADETDKPKKLRKFCSLPSRVDGERDSTWIDVYMEGVDEVGAHCGLFFLGEHYDKLIGDVGMRIAEWVHDDMTVRLLRENH